IRTPRLRCSRCAAYPSLNNDRRRTMARKPATRAQFTLFDVVYEDGSERSNGRVPSGVLGGLDGDAPARAVIEEQDRLIAEKSDGSADGGVSTRKAIVMGVAFFWSTLPIAAADTEMTQEYSICLEKSNGVTVEMINCILAETIRQDARLNENYKRLISKLVTERKNTLIEAQRNWIKFRDTNCGFYADPEGGSAARLAANECILNATAQRAKELRLLNIN